MMLAILPSEPCWPARRMPHSGFTPTGAEIGLAETPWRTEELPLCWSCGGGCERERVGGRAGRGRAWRKKRLHQEYDGTWWHRGSKSP